MKPSVLAIVVTYNRPEVLKGCIESLLTQTGFGLARIHVVVNSTDEATPALLKLYQNTFDLTFECLENEGPAGGFHVGLAEFIKSGMDYAWLMDDDIIAKGNCLEELMKCAVTHEFVYPRVLTFAGEEVVSYGWWGVLLRRSLVEKAGLPRKDLFYWSEDTEYLQNRILVNLGIAPKRCLTAAVEHLHARKIKRPSWYFYYVPRNTLYYRIYIVGYTWRRLWRTLWMFPTLIFAICFKEDRKLKKLFLFWYGVMHGLAGKTGKLVDPEKNK